MCIRTVLLAGCLWLILAVGGCNKTGDAEGGKADAGGGGNGAKKGPQAIPVLVAPVQLLDYAPAIVLQGEIRATQQTALAAEVAGKVVAIAHRVGEKHGRSAGALISIDPATYDTQIAAARADLDEAQEELKLLRNGPRQQEIAAQEAAVAAARAKADQAQDNLRRQEELFSQGAIAETALIEARTAAQTAQAALDAAQQVLDALRLGSRSEDIAAAQARVDQTYSSLEAARLQRTRTAVAAPFDAVVTALYVEVGQYVGPGTPLCEVVADKPAEAWFNLPQANAAQVAPGASVELRSAAQPERVYTGIVISLSPAADPLTRQFPLRVALKDPQLKPGMAVTGRILTTTPVPTVCISDNAPFESKLGMVVYRMVPVKAASAGAEAGAGSAAGQAPGGPAGVEMVPVELGEHIDDSVVLVKGDLQPGDLLVTRGKELLFENAKINPVNLKPPAGGAKPDAATKDTGGAAAGGAR